MWRILIDMKNKTKLKIAFVAGLILIVTLFTAVPIIGHIFACGSLGWFGVGLYRHMRIRRDSKHTIRINQ